MNAYERTIAVLGSFLTLFYIVTFFTSPTTWAVMTMFYFGMLTILFAILSAQIRIIDAIEKADHRTVRKVERSTSSTLPAEPNA